ncbi:MAG: hypothetical protein ACKVIS_12255, partial [Pseudomonadales bacterium]
AYRQGAVYRSRGDGFDQLKPSAKTEFFSDSDIQMRSRGYSYQVFHRGTCKAGLSRPCIDAG